MCPRQPRGEPPTRGQLLVCVAVVSPPPGRLGWGGPRERGGWAGRSKCSRRCRLCLPTLHAGLKQTQIRDRLFKNGKNIEVTPPPVLSLVLPRSKQRQERSRSAGRGARCLPVTRRGARPLGRGGRGRKPPPLGRPVLGVRGWGGSGRPPRERCADVLLTELCDEDSRWESRLLDQSLHPEQPTYAFLVSEPA